MTESQRTPKRPPRTADYSDERRAVILSLIDRPAFRDAKLTDDDRFTYVLGALVADEMGRIARDDLHRAALDPSADQYARTLLRKAGY